MYKIFQSYNEISINLTSITCEEGMVSVREGLGRNLNTWNSAANIFSSVVKYETL